MFALNLIGTTASVVYMINHGLSTGAMFLCVGMIYERFHTRQMSEMSGLARVMPVWAFFMVFFCFASVGLPGLNGFVGEFLVLLGAFQAKGVLGDGFTPAYYAACAGTGMILGAIYILYMVGRVVFGPVRIPEHDSTHSTADAIAKTAGHPTTHDLNLREIITLTPLAVCCLLLGLFPTVMLKTLEPPVDRSVAAFPASDCQSVRRAVTNQIAQGSWPCVNRACSTGKRVSRP